MSGLTADARTLIDHARVEGQNYRFTYDEPISVESLTHAVCDLALRFGEDRGDDDNAMVSDLEIYFASICRACNSRAINCARHLVVYFSKVYYIGAYLLTSHSRIEPTFRCCFVDRWCR
jgi:hypothetical protein